MLESSSHVALYLSRCLISLSLLNPLDLRLLVSSPVISSEPFQFSSLGCFTEAFCTIDHFLLKILLRSWLPYSSGFPPLAAATQSVYLIVPPPHLEMIVFLRVLLQLFALLSCILSGISPSDLNYMVLFSNS